jgi:3-oxoacyl-[acyl-carrier-protein] synthase II
VVTGLGAVTPEGVGLDAYWAGVRGGVVAIREVEHLPMDGYRTQLGGEVTEDFTPTREYLQPDGFHDRAIDFTMRAAEEAMSSSGTAAEQVPPERWGVVIGTCNAGLLAGEEWYAKRKRGENPDPRLVLLVEPQAFSDALASAFQLKGPVLSVDTACAASANAIGYAAELIREGHADAMLTGGADAFSDILIAGFNALESLSPEPAAPYSFDRKGLSLGEGAGVLVLMDADVAAEIGAPVLAEIVGYGLSADGYHPTAPHPEGRGASRAIQTALRLAGVDPGDVDYVNSHGTGTAKNDTAETAATKVGLGDAAYHVAVSSTKSMIGHLLGGAGAAEAIVTVKAIDEQVAPPTANFTEPDPECDLDYVPNVAREMTIDIALSNNFAFGGANASVLFARPGARADGPPARNVDRAVVTGVAALSTAGTDPAALFDAYAEGRRCTSTENGVELGRVALAAEEYLDVKERKRVDRLGLFSIISSRLALANAGLELTDDNRTRVGAVVGTGVGPMESMENFAAPVIEEGAGGANPAVFPNTVYNAAGGQVAIKNGILGSASTVTAGHAAGASALCYGYDLTTMDHADAVVCIGADTLTDTVVQAYQELGVLASSANGDGGFALAEGGFAVLVERLGAARARGAKPLGEIRGFAITCDAVGVGKVDTEGAGIERAMRQALERADVAAGDVVAVWANRNGLQAADEAEAKAIERLLGPDVPVLAPKLLFGEPMGAGATLATVLALEGWSRGDEANSPRGPVLVNSLSLGGTNFAVVLAPVED